MKPPPDFADDLKTLCQICFSPRCSGNCAEPKEPDPSEPDPRKDDPPAAGPR